MEGIGFNNDPKLLDQYLEWTEQTVKQMRDLLNSCSGDFFSDVQKQELYGLSHNIKGMGSSFNYPLMTDVGQSLCAYLSACENGEKIQSKIVDSHLRVFEVVLAHQITGDGGEKGSMLKQRLAELVASD